MSTMDMQNNLFYRLILHIYWLTVCNCYFFLFCIPFLLSLFWFWNHPNTITLLLTLVSFIPIPPALTASYHVMGKIIREKQVELTKSFFYGVKTNFIQCSMLGLFQAILTIILAVDILFMKQHALGLYVIPFLYILLLLNVCVGIYLYPLLSYFQMKSWAAIKLAIWCFTTKWKTTIILSALIALLYLLLYHFPKIPWYLVVGPFCFAVMYITSHLFVEIEEHFQSN